jgi:lambda family phage portal protein
MAWRSTIVRTLARLMGVREYDGAKTANHVWGGGSRVSASSNANADLLNSRSVLRERSRASYQNHSSARALIDAKVGLVVSSGIDIEPDTGDEATDAALRSVWSEWVEQADAAGLSCLWDLQRQAYRSELMAGEFLWILVNLDTEGRVIPAALMAIEPDRLSANPVAALAPGSTFVDGVEIDAVGRPVAFHIVDGDGDGIHSPLGGTAIAGSGGRPVAGGTTSGSGKGKRFPASQVFHGYEILRPGMVRGEPALAPVLNTLRQEQQLVETELTAAKVSAAHAVAVMTEAGDWPESTDPNTSTDNTGGPSYDFAPGTVSRLAPGEKLEIVKSERPSQQISPFRAMLRGDLAGAMAIPSRLIDRDVSRANYSSMRADMLDTRRQLDPVQQRFGRTAALDVYRRILPQLAVAAGLSIPAAGTPERRQFERAKIMPDGWAYVDPQKDVAAGIDAIRAGFSTWQEEIGSRGRDPRRVAEQLKKELTDPLLGDIFDADKSRPAPAQTAPAKDEEKPEKPTKEAAAEDEARMVRAHERAVDLVRAGAPVLSISPAIHVPAQSAPVVNVAAAEVRVDVPAPVVHVQTSPAPVVNVNVPEQREQSAPVVHVNVPQQPAPIVNVAPAAVTVQNTVEVPQRAIKATPQKDGTVIMRPLES